MERKRTYRCLPVILATIALAGCVGSIVTPAGAQPTAEVSKDTWRFAVSPNYWASILAGSLTLEQPPDPLHAGNYILDVGTGHLGSGFLVSGMVGKGRWDFDAQVAASSVADSGMFLLADMPEDSVAGYYDFGWSEATLRLNFRIGPYLSPYVRIYAGIRWINWTTDLTDNASAPLGSWDETWIDPLVGARTRFSLGGGFSGTAHVDAAGFSLGSQLSWTISGGLSYHVAGPLHLEGTYAYKQVSYDNGKDGDELFYWKDGVAQGWFFGATVAFPATKK